MPLTVNEAAVLAHVPPGRIRKAIEEGVIQRVRPAAGSRSSATFVSSDAVLYAALLARLELPLPLDKKLKLVKSIKRSRAAARQFDAVEIAPAVTVDVQRLLGSEVADRIHAYEALRDEVIERNPDVLGGTPVIRGTRISAYALLGRVASGESADQIREDFPELSNDMIDIAVTYAKAHPRMGRPAGRPWQAAA